MAKRKKRIKKVSDFQLTLSDGNDVTFDELGAPVPNTASSFIPSVFHDILRIKHIKRKLDMKLKILLLLIRLIPNSVLVTLIDLAFSKLTGNLSKKKQQKYRKITVNIIKKVIHQVGELDVRVSPDKVEVHRKITF